jgi:hypothetical protein
MTREFKALPPGRQSFIIRRIEEAAKPETVRSASKTPLPACRVIEQPHDLAHLPEHR